MITRRSLITISLLLLMTLPSVALANVKGDQLRRTMANISLFNSQLSQRKTDASGIRDILSTRLAELKKEVLGESRKEGLKTEADAVKHPRVLYDLMLMAEIQAYIKKYKDKMAYYRVACDRLSYLYQQADDDLKIVNTLSDMKIDALISQAEKVLDGYLPEAQTIILHGSDLKLDLPEKVWKAVQTGK